jgi:hypothetical protein
MAASAGTVIDPAAPRSKARREIGTGIEKLDREKRMGE